jgi:hypothetical protein
LKYFVKVGERYNRLVILATHQRVEGKRSFYNLCQCDCGNRCFRTSSELVREIMKSCGCAYREQQKRGNFVHGGTSRVNGKLSLAYLYGFWLRIRSRCHNPLDKAYPHWGGRGITLFEGWHADYSVFRDWVEEHLGPRPSLSHRLERWDRKGGFEPGNLLWVTEEEQYALRKGLVAALLAAGFIFQFFLQT